MPQRDDKVGVYFGRIDQALWDRLGELPAATIEKAIAALAEARAAGRTINYPAVPKRGIRKKVWLTPGTARVLKSIGEEAGYQNTSVILAALDLHFGAPAHGASRQGDSPGEAPSRSGTP
jgi:hypothetical protein